MGVHATFGGPSGHGFHHWRRAAGQNDRLTRAFLQCRPQAFEQREHIALRLVDAVHFVGVLGSIDVGEMLVTIAEHGDRPRIRLITQALRGLKQRWDAETSADEHIIRSLIEIEGRAQRAKHIDGVPRRQLAELVGAETDHREDEAHLVAIHLADSERTRHEVHGVRRIQIHELRRSNMAGDVFVTEGETDDARSELLHGDNADGAPGRGETGLLGLFHRVGECGWHESPWLFGVRESVRTTIAYKSISVMQGRRAAGLAYRPPLRGR
ncbi:hypothetical protein BAAM1489_00120 [Bifidobacterium animalis subsp. animalis MCC 1489]|nr:hypothetical protein BAAM0499_02090 [Bifidobacterium animalis subsp. animalis MCC 0499]KOA65025.1 hypothetical protein BAAM1489_00120 [Bifidobacterium animalis subsp. animalis MCC 1489]